MGKSKKVKKEKRKIGTGQKIFQIVNTLLVVAILGYYLQRMFYYKALFESNNSATADETQLLGDVIQKKVTLMDKEGLFQDEENECFYFKGVNVDNYLVYSGKLYRILQIDSDGTITVISEDVVNSFLMYENTTLQNSHLYNWLNETNVEGSGVYLESLDTPYSHLVNTISYNTVIDKLDENTDYGSPYEEGFVSLPSLKQYILAGGASSFINNGTAFLLANTNSNGDYYFVNEDGNVATYSASAKFRPFRIVMTLKYETKAYSGDGSKAAPFVLDEEFEKQSAKDLAIGDVVNYGNYNWKVNSHDENGNVVLIMDGLVKDENDYVVSEKFGTNYLYGEKSGVGKYLNTTFLKQLPDYERLLVKGNWNTGIFEGATDYNWETGKTSTVESYVGIPSLGDYFLDSYTDYFVGNRSFESDKLCYLIDNDGKLYEDLLTGKHCMRAMIVLNSETSLLAGDGSAQNPFQIIVNYGG